MKETDLLINIVRRRIRLSWIIRNSLFTVSVAFGLGIVVALVDLISARPVPIGTIGLSLIGLAIVTGVVHAYLRPLDSTRLLIRIERRLGSASTLLAAAELSKHGNHRFADAITARADVVAQKALDGHAAANVIPLSLPKRWYTIVVLAAIFLGAALTVNDIRERSIDTSVVELGSYLSEYGATLAARAADDSLSESLDIAKEMQRLGAELQRNRIDREDAEQMLSQLAEEVQRRMQGLSRTPVPDSTSTEAPVSEESTETPDGSRGFPSNPSPNDVQVLYQKLLREGSLSDEEAGFLDDVVDQLDSPRAAKDGLDEATLDELDELSERLERISEEELLDSVERAVEDARNRLGREPDPEGVAKGDSPAGKGDSNRIDAGGNENAGAGGAPETDRDEGTGNSGGEGALGAGTTEVEDEFTDDFESSRDDSTPIGDVGGDISTEETVVRTLVRNLPEDSESSVAFEDLRRTYEKQRERAMVREDIPLSTRAYVRDYFLELTRIEESRADE